MRSVCFSVYEENMISNSNLSHHTQTHTQLLATLAVSKPECWWYDDEGSHELHFVNTDECVSFMTHGDRIPCGPFVSHSMWHHLTLQCDMVESHHATDALVTMCHSHSNGLDNTTEGCTIVQCLREVFTFLTSVSQFSISKRKLY